MQSVSHSAATRKNVSSAVCTALFSFSDSRNDVNGIVMFYLAFWTWVLIKLPDQGLEPEPLLPEKKYERFYTGVFAYTFRVQMILLGCVLAFMCVMGIAQWTMMELDDEPPPPPKPQPAPGTDAQLAAVLAALCKKAKSGDEDEDIEAEELLLLLRLLRRGGFAGFTKRTAAAAPQQPVAAAVRGAAGCAAEPQQPAPPVLAQRPWPPLAEASQARPPEPVAVRQRARTASPEKEQTCW